MKVGILVALLVGSVTLAGCSGDAASDETDVTEDDGLAANEAVTVPKWSVGDWWTYKDSAGRTFTLVVTEDAGTDYILDTDQVTLAFYHDQAEPISYLGPFSKSGLQGEEDGQRVNFFDFPLQDGDEWSLNLDGTSFRAEAHDIGDGSFHIPVYEGEVLRHQWVYDNATRFFEWMSFGDANGTESFRIDLQDSGTAWTGDAIRVHAEPFFNVDLTGPTADTGLFTDWSPSADSGVWLALDFNCEQGELTFAIGAVESIPNSNDIVVVTENEDGGTWASPCPFSLEQPIFANIGVQPANGQWGYIYDLASPDATLTATAWLAEYERITL